MYSGFTCRPAGTVIRLTADRLPSRGEPKPLWLWWPKADTTDADVDRCRQAFLRRFDIEHTFRLLKQTLGWTVPRLREPAAADRWTWPRILSCVSPGPSRRTYADPGNAR
ncbi:hypothetical protein GCM10025331_50980 [Actinoplanes utahensis]|nr:hypothetical protein Aut01nite_65260 [Actinoplanes utahensis]